MKISVITVCLNSARTIGHTLETFFRQDHPSKEIIVVDGGSHDDTLGVVRSFATDGLTVISEPDEGPYDAANKGLALYAGDAVGLLNSDDGFADDHALRHIADALVRSDITFGNVDFVADHRSSEVLRHWRGSPYANGAFRRGWMPAHPTFYAKRSVVDALAGFDTRYSVAADYDFMLRALELNDFRTSFIDRVLVRMMHGGERRSGLKALVTHGYEALRSRMQWLDPCAFDCSQIPSRTVGPPPLGVPSVGPGWPTRVGSDGNAVTSQQRVFGADRARSASHPQQ